MLKFSDNLRKPLRLNILFLELTSFYQCNGTIQWLGMHSVQLRQLRADPISVFKIFTGPLDVFFTLPIYTTLEGAPTRYSMVRATSEGEGRPLR